MSIPNNYHSLTSGFNVYIQAKTIVYHTQKMKIILQDFVERRWITNFSFDSRQPQRLLLLGDIKLNDRKSNGIYTCLVNASSFNCANQRSPSFLPCTATVSSTSVLSWRIRNMHQQTFTSALSHSKATNGNSIITLRHELLDSCNALFPRQHKTLR